jgi:hypothetical protein
MRRLINWAGKLDMNVIFIAHEKADWGTNGGGERTQIGVTFDGYDKLAYELHLALHAQKRGPARMAVVKKSRLTGFPDADSFSLDYQEFAARYGKDIIEAKTKAIELAKPEQVTEVKTLVENVRITEEEIQKWFTKAEVDSWEEMTTEQIAKCISFLKGKVK